MPGIDSFPSSIVRVMLRYGLPSLLPLFLQLIIGYHLLEEGNVSKPSLHFSILQNFILLFRTEFVLIFSLRLCLPTLIFYVYTL